MSNTTTEIDLDLKPQTAGAGKRICPTTGLPVCLDAQLFVRLHAVVAIVFLLVGGGAAILLALTRWQTVHLLRADWFYRIVTLHGLNMLIFWILSFEVAILYFVGTSLLNARLFSRKVAHPVARGHRHDSNLPAFAPPNRATRPDLVSHHLVGPWTPVAAG
jgi:hypothetical protein